MTLPEIGAQFWQELTARPDGPLAFRFVLQPAVALMLAIRDGIRDARIGRDPYLWTILRRSDVRREQLREGLAATSRVIGFAVVMDLAYQLFVLKGIRPLETVVIAFTLAFLPYLLARGPAARLARAFQRSR